MRFRNCCWLSSLIAISLCVTAGLAQPPALDSTYMFDEYGVLTAMAPLPDGNTLVAGQFREDGVFFSQLRGMNAARQFEWTQTLSTTAQGAVEGLCVGTESVLVRVRERVPIDSITWTTRSNFECHSFAGDSLWEIRLDDDSVNFVTLGPCAATADGGFLVQTLVSYVDSIWVRWSSKLTKLGADGELEWERFYGDSAYGEPGGLIVTNADSIMMALFEVETRGPIVRFVWLDADGNPGREARFDIEGIESNSVPVHFIATAYGYDLIWANSAPGNLNYRLNLLRIDDSGAQVMYTRAVASVNRYHAFIPVESGLLVAGNGDFGQNTGVYLGHLGANSSWYFLTQYPAMTITSVVGALPGVGIGAFGAMNDIFFDTHPALYYFGDLGAASYLYTTPSRLDFGLVPLEETRELQFAFQVTGDSTVTITDFLMPESYAISEQTPVVVPPGAVVTVRVGFRPEERREFLDTLSVVSSGLNPVIAVPLTGAAPFPLCEPHTQQLDFRWCLVGDTARETLRLENPGTEPLHIDALADPLPFRVSDAGPFTVDVEGSLDLSLWVTAAEPGVINRELLIYSDEPATPDTIRLTVRVVEEPDAAGDAVPVPRELRLYAAYPNPFNAATTLRFDLPRESAVQLELFDVNGRRVRTLVDEPLTAGTHAVRVELSTAASGLYFAVLRAQGATQVQKVLLVK